MITKRYLNAGLNDENGYADTEAFVGFTTAYDPASNKKYERHLHAELRSHLYPAQDSLDRLRQYQRGTLQQDSQGNVTVQTPITLPDTDTDRTYDLDGLGNWRRTAHTPVGGAETTEVRQHNYLNQVMRFDSTPVLYDHGNNAASADPDVARRGNGNITDDGVRLYAYDAFNRLKEVRRKSDGALIAAYTYDALGRRIRKAVSGGGLTGDIPNGTTDFLYSGVQCVEERNPFGGEQEDEDTPLRQYVWGRYVDELIQQRDIEGQEYADYYLLSDLLYRSVALTDVVKAIQEAYDTDAYGNTLIFDQPGTAGNWFASNAHRTNVPRCRFVFTGREYDPETQMYFYRARYYQQVLGRFVARDPIGYTEGVNLYEYVRGGPAGNADPRGLQVMERGATDASQSRRLTARERKMAKRQEMILKVTENGFGPGDYERDCCCLVTIIIELPELEATGLEEKGLGGHTGVGIDGEFYDYGPDTRARGNIITGIPGDQWWDAPRRWPLRSTPEDIGISDILDAIKEGVWPQPPGQHDVFKAKIAVTRQQCDRMRNYWEGIYQHLGTFSILGRHCTTTAMESLKRGGLYSRGFGVHGPGDLLRDLSKVKHTCGPNAGKRVKVVQIAWEKL